MSATIISTGLIVAIILYLYRTYQKITNGICKSRRRLDDKVAVITGGTAGMGLEVAKDFVKRGAKVIIACPFEQEGKDALETIIKETASKRVVFKPLDLASFASVRRFAAEILETEDRLDILVNNAGGLFDRITEDGTNATMQINYFGHVLLTLLLLPLLVKSGSSRIVFVCSLLHWLGHINVQDLNRTGNPIALWYYCDAKLCVLHFSRELRKRLQGTGVSVNCVEPGMVGTRIFDVLKPKWIASFITWVSKTFYKTPWEGAQNAIYAAVDAQCEIGNGCYVKDCKPYGWFRPELSNEDANKFWVESLKIVSLKDYKIVT